MSPRAPAMNAEQQTAMVEALCRAIERADTPPSLQELAASVSRSVFYTQRLFRQVTGVTPRAYAAALRARRMQALLVSAPSVTDAMLDAGFAASSRFYENVGPRLGMTPKAWRRQGSGERIRFALGQCCLGAVLVAATARGVCALTLGDSPEVLLEEFQARFARATLVGDDPEFETWVALVVGYVERPAGAFPLPLDVRGTAFQERVWQALQCIPVGETINYAELAARIGAPRASRAVARACASNGIAVAIPCHRVIRTDGGLSGYRWGVERKAALLRRERSS